jgi:hypothetical protein
VAFHVDRLGARRLEQRPLVGGRGHDALTAHQDAASGLEAASDQAVVHLLAPDPVD